MYVIKLYRPTAQLIYHIYKSLSFAQNKHDVDGSFMPI